MNKKILVADPEFSEILDKVSQKFNNYSIFCPIEGKDLPVLLSEKYDTVICKTANVSREIIDSVSESGMIMKMGRCYQNIDVEYARSRGIKLYATPRKGPNCVAELGMTLILALSKDLIISHSSVVNTAYRYRGLKPILTDQNKMAFHWMANAAVHEVRGKTLGIIGMGEIGCELSLRANVMGMKVFYYKRHPFSRELEARFNAVYAELAELMRICDYVYLSVPQTSDTEGMISMDLLNQMKQTAFFINTCRGGNVDESALIEVLKNRKIAGAGLDVFQFEPLPEDNPLLGLDNVILTPHIGGGTGTNRDIELTETMEEIDKIFHGAVPQVDFSKSY